MVALRAVGKLSACKTFDRDLNMFRVACVPLFEDYNRWYVEDNLRMLLKHAGDPELERALRACLDERYYRGVWRAGRRIWWSIKLRVQPRGAF